MPLWADTLVDVGGRNWTNRRSRNNVRGAFIPAAGIVVGRLLRLMLHFVICLVRSCGLAD
jgi:hypothetical protein